MIKTHVKIAWRNTLKNRRFTLLNVLGLSAGLACTLLIWLWIRDELSVDKFFDNDSQIYQLMERRTTAVQSLVSDESSGMLGEMLAARMPQIIYAAAVAPYDWFQKFTLSVGEKNIKADGQYAGKDYFNIFSFKVLDGKRNEMLATKDDIAISNELALKLFGTTQNIIGKAVRFQHERNFFVSGVFEKPSVHSSQQFDFVLSFEYMKDAYPWVTSWTNTGPHNFVLLKKGTDINAFNKKIANVVNEATGDTTRSAFAVRFSENYLLNTFSHGSQVGSRIKYVKLFSLIAIFILSIACINFMNLSTAKASRRLKEVGVKKVMGASRKSLLTQFLIESIILACFAMMVAFLITWLLLPSFNGIMGKKIQLLSDAELILTLLAITFVTGILAGIYPAIYLSGFRPAAVLKAKFQNSVVEVFSRKGLVVFQFTLSSILILSVLVVYKQIQYIQNTNPGYNKDNIIRFNAESGILTNGDGFINELKRIPGVVSASYTWHSMVGRNYGDYGLSWDGKDPNEPDYFEGFGVGYEFVETMEMQMAMGRSFSRNYGADSSAIILNEAAVALMHLKNPVGKKVTYFDRPLQIIGIVKDFHFESLHEPVKPCFLILSRINSIWNKIIVRIRAQDQATTIHAIGVLYGTYATGFPFDYNFLDAAYQQQYTAETRIGILSRYFAGLAILISCLGLFGLTAFTAQKRQKEIGIRKVVGASVKSIIVLLSADFFKLVLIAMVIAFPAAGWAMTAWLRSFAYRIHMGWPVFAITATSVFLITLLTISFEAIKAALANPVQSLRSD